MSRKEVNFSSDQPDFMKELREQVKNYFNDNNLTRYGNKSIVAKSIVMGLFYIVPYLLMVFGVVHTIPLLLIGWILMGIGMAGLGMVLMHDANHSSYSKNARVNKFLGYSMYILGGFPTNWQIQHNILHHGYTNIDGHDDDIESISLLRFTPNQPLKKIHRFQHFYAWFFYSLMTISFITITDYDKVIRYNNMGITLNKKDTKKRLMIQLILSKIIYFAIVLVIPLVFVSAAWYWTVLLFLVMHFVAGLILTTIFQTAHVVPQVDFPVPDNEGNIENNWAIHQLQTTSNFAPKSKVFSWFIGGLNYQIEHHLFPYISHVHYRKIAPIVKAAAKKYNLPYHVQDNFIAAVWGHAKMLKLLGK